MKNFIYKPIYLASVISVSVFFGKVLGEIGCNNYFIILGGMTLICLFSSAAFDFMFVSYSEIYGVIDKVEKEIAAEKRNDNQADAMRMALRNKEK